MNHPERVTRPPFPSYEPYTPNASVHRSSHRAYEMPRLNDHWKVVASDVWAAPAHYEEPRAPRSRALHTRPHKSDMDIDFESDFILFPSGSKHVDTMGAPLPSTRSRRSDYDNAMALIPSESAIDRSWTPVLQGGRVAHRTPRHQPRQAPSDRSTRDRTMQSLSRRSRQSPDGSEPSHNPRRDHGRQWSGPLVPIPPMTPNSSRPMDRSLPRHPGLDEFPPAFPTSPQMKRLDSPDPYGEDALVRRPSSSSHYQTFCDCAACDVLSADSYEDPEDEYCYSSGNEDECYLRGRAREDRRKRDAIEHIQRSYQGFKPLPGV